METYPAGWTVEPQDVPPPEAGIFHMRWPWWRAVLLETYAAMSEDRLLAVAAGVVFYALLAIFPAITAFVSFYGLFANAGAVQDHLSVLANFLPSGGLTIVQEQIERIASQPSGLSVGFAVGLLIALWSANAGVKAMMDALNVIEGHDERRSFVRLNLLSLSFTVGAIAFVMLAVGAVVAFPLVMSAFGWKDFTDTATWLVRWPLLFALLTGDLDGVLPLRAKPRGQSAMVAFARRRGRGAALARGLGGAVVLSVEFRRLQRDLRLARRRHRPDDVDVAVDHRRAARRAARHRDRPEAAGAGLKRAPLLDHLVGGEQQLRRNLKPERLGGFDVDAQDEFRRLRDRQVGRLFAFEDAGDRAAGLFPQGLDVGAVADQSAGLHIVQAVIDRRHVVARRKRDDLRAPREEKRIGRRPAARRRASAFDRPPRSRDRCWPEDLELHAERSGCLAKEV